MLKQRKKSKYVVDLTVKLGHGVLQTGEYSDESTRLFERFSKEPIHPDSDPELKAYIDKRIMTRPESRSNSCASTMA